MQVAKVVVTLASVTFAAMPVGAANAHNAHETQAHSISPTRAMTATATQTKLDATKAVLRDLWIAHVFWVRNVAVAALAGDTAAQMVAEKQVVANAQAIAETMEPFYGVEAKKQMFTLLAGHYGGVKAYLNATIAKDVPTQSGATTALMRNARDIAAFLSAANPYLPIDTVEGLLQAHAGHHISQIQQLQAKDNAAEAQTWTEMTQHMYIIADATAEALAQQFTEKF
jgi:hypothetical protein